MENNKKELRNDAVSIAKGIAIILMVMAHSRFSIWLQYYINMFHMPLFFLLWLLLQSHIFECPKEICYDKNKGNLFSICEMGVCFFYFIIFL